MPTLIGGNTNAPCMVIGEPAARFVLAGTFAPVSPGRWLFSGYRGRPGGSAFQRNSP